MINRYSKRKLELEHESGDEEYQTEGEEDFSNHPKRKKPSFSSTSPISSTSSTSPISSTPSTSSISSTSSTSSRKNQDIPIYWVLEIPENEMVYLSIKKWKGGKINVDPKENVIKLKFISILEDEIYFGN